MRFDWYDYLTLARELADPDPGSTVPEARHRSAISRAYYAAFKIAPDYLQRQQPGIAVVRGDIHTYVRERLEFSPSAELRGIGIALDRLRRERNRADYEPDIDHLAATAVKAIEQATTIVAYPSSQQRQSESAIALSTAGPHQLVAVAAVGHCLPAPTASGRASCATVSIAS